MDTYVTVLDLESDAALHRFGPFLNASAARVAAGAKTGRLLTWRKDSDLWRAEAAPHAYLVPADPPVQD
ncbi:hypothetical protein GCM10008959_26280 [Deinococcus seoulensis]|uniref:DUF1330 domain-containing protein n=1 Tax=Deinococcus seoulensis TaxID=1837379 RepID=A0ABQ2RT62_9DEIO|nr:hypothetical protein [Deinococcus seoulensis]GGR62951.1 hypothetical protein GCM10008959_26280 [Deinococcus seoulensis]